MIIRMLVEVIGADCNAGMNGSESFTDQLDNLMNIGFKHLLTD